MKKLVLRKCYVTAELLETLLILVQHQLDELMMTYDEDISQLFDYARITRGKPFNQGNMT